VPRAHSLLNTASKGSGSRASSATVAVQLQCQGKAPGVTMLSCPGSPAADAGAAAAPAAMLRVGTLSGSESTAEMC
jgi:hypothetical protein